MCLSGANTFFFLHTRKTLHYRNCRMVWPWRKLWIFQICIFQMDSFFSLSRFHPPNLTKSMKKSMKQSSFLNRRNQFRHNSVEESCISCKESILTVSIELYALTFHRTTLHWLCSSVVFSCSLDVLTLTLVGDLPILARRANAYQIFAADEHIWENPLKWRKHTHNTQKFLHLLS